MSILTQTPLMNKSIIRHLYGIRNCFLIMLRLQMKLGERTVPEGTAILLRMLSEVLGQEQELALVMEIPICLRYKLTNTCASCFATKEGCNFALKVID